MSVFGSVISGFNEGMRQQDREDNASRLKNLELFRQMEMDARTRGEEFSVKDQLEAISALSGGRGYLVGAIPAAQSEEIRKSIAASTEANAQAIKFERAHNQFVKKDQAGTIIEKDIDSALLNGKTPEDAVRILQEKYKDDKYALDSIQTALSGAGDLNVRRTRILRGEAEKKVADYLRVNPEGTLADMQAYFATETNPEVRNIGIQIAKTRDLERQKQRIADANKAVIDIKPDILRRAARGSEDFDVVVSQIALAYKVDPSNKEAMEVIRANLRNSVNGQKRIDDDEKTDKMANIFRTDPNLSAAVAEAAQDPSRLHQTVKSQLQGAGVTTNIDDRTTQVIEILKLSDFGKMVNAVEGQNKIATEMAIKLSSDEARLTSNNLSTPKDTPERMIADSLKNEWVILDTAGASRLFEEGKETKEYKAAKTNIEKANVLGDYFRSEGVKRGYLATATSRVPIHAQTIKQSLRNGASPEVITAFLPTAYEQMEKLSFSINDVFNGAVHSGQIDDAVAKAHVALNSQIILPLKGISKNPRMGLYSSENAVEIDAAIVNAERLMEQIRANAAHYKTANQLPSYQDWQKKQDQDKNAAELASRREVIGSGQPAQSGPSPAVTGLGQTNGPWGAATAAAMNEYSARVGEIQKPDPRRGAFTQSALIDQIAKKYSNGDPYAAMQIGREMKEKLGIIF